MKNFYLLALLLIGLQGFSQWTKNNDYPGGERMGTVSFVLDNQLHILGGLKLSGGNYVAYDDFRSYNAPFDTWTELANFPAGKTYGGFGFVIDSTAYVGLGSDENGSLSNQVWSYNANDGWTQLSNFPGIRRVYPFQFTVAGKGYVGTGFGTNYLKDVWEYDPENDQWTKKDDYAGSGRVGVTAFSLGDMAYAGVGDDGSFFYTDFYAYDPSNDTWTSKAAFPGANASFPSSTGVYTKGYLIGGEYEHLLYTNEMWSYDPAADEWKSEWNFTGIPRRYGVFQFVDGTFYYGLGQIGPNDNNVTDDFWEIETGIISAVSSTKADTKLLAYPNPFQDQLNLPVSALDHTLKIQVYNSLMELVYAGPAASLNTAHWSSQMYLIRYTSQDGEYTQKLVKQ